MKPFTDHELRLYASQGSPMAEELLQARKEIHHHRAWSNMREHRRHFMFMGVTFYTGVFSEEEDADRAVRELLRILDLRLVRAGPEPKTLCTHYPDCDNFKPCPVHR